MSRLESGSLDASTQAKEGEIRKVINHISIDENLRAPEVDNDQMTPLSLKSKKSLKIDIPEQWNGLYGDIS